MWPTTIRWSAAVALAATTFTSARSAGQTPTRIAAPQAASVEGDVYLMMESGDVKRGAGRTVFLLRGTPELQAGIDTICAAFHTRDKQLVDSFRIALKDSADAAYSALMADLANKKKMASWDYHSNRYNASLENSFEPLVTRDANRSVMFAAVDAAVSRSVVDTVGTGINAHFQFANAGAGNYVLFAEWTIGSNHYRWWAPVSLSPGQSMKRDLDNSVEASATLYCGVRRP